MTGHTARPPETGMTPLLPLFSGAPSGWGSGNGVRGLPIRAPAGGLKTWHRVGPHRSCSNHPGMSGTHREPRALGLCHPQLGLDQSGRPQRCPLPVVRPSSCGHWPVCDVSSACPVLTALSAALAPDPLASRTLDTFCFERKQTLLKLLLGA